MPSFIGVHSSLELVKKRGLLERGEGLLLYWGAFQLETCKKALALEEGGGVPSFLGERFAQINDFQNKKEKPFKIYFFGGLNSKPNLRVF